jgi:hypothetical protein
MEGHLQAAPGLVHLPLAAVAATEEGDPEGEFDCFVRQRAKQQFAKHWMKEADNRVLMESKSYDERRTLGRAAFDELPAASRRAWLVSLRDKTPLPGIGAAPTGETAVGARVVGGSLDNNENEEPDKWRSRGFLFTWNGDWGLGDPAVQAVLGRDLPTQATADALAAVPGHRAVFERFWNFIQSFGQKHGFPQVTAAMEYGGHSVASGRVHLHAFVSNPRNPVRVGAALQTLTFENIPLGHAEACRRCRNEVAGLAEGHWYLQMPKLGHMHHATTYHKNVDFAVSHKWCLRKWQVRKIGDVAVQDEVLASRSHVPNVLRDIQRTLALEKDSCNRKQEALLASQTLPLPFKPPCTLERLWLEQYTPEKKSQLLRFKTLVYDGPTRLGKTERMLHWLGANRTLVINAQGTSTPDLHEWNDYHMWDGILFDEASWELVFANKLLFQAGRRRVKLGQSACNIASYSVFVHGVPLMISSNDFWEKCPHAARSWIEGNIYYVKVTEPTWLPDTGASSSN